MIDIISTGAILGIGTTLLYSLRDIPMKLFNRVKGRYVYTVRVYQYDELFTALESYMKEHHIQRFRDVEAFISESPLWEGSYPTAENGIDDTKSKCINYRQEEDIFTVEYKDKNLIVNKLKEKVDKNVGGLKDMFFRKFVISGWRAKDVISEFLNVVLVEYQAKKVTDAVLCYTHDAGGYWEFNSSNTVKPIDDIVLKDSISSFIIKDVEEFYASKDWYISLGIPYKRGYCFYGPPGTGKTSISLALASKFKKKIYYINLNSLDSDSALVKCISNTPKNSIILMEDIDKAFAGRESINEKVSFSTLLNCLDGVLYKEGSVVIITTNYIDQLDEALIRPGRIDIKVLIENPGDEEISTYLSRFYKEELGVKDTPSQSMGNIQGICIKNKNNKEEAIKQILGHNIA